MHYTCTCTVYVACCTDGGLLVLGQLPTVSKSTYIDRLRPLHFVSPAYFSVTSPPNCLVSRTTGSVCELEAVGQFAAFSFTSTSGNTCAWYTSYMKERQPRQTGHMAHRPDKQVAQTR